MVVPAYQNVEFVAATLDSILAQTFTDFELLIADHGSTDGTWAAVQPFAADPRVRLWQTPAGGGAAANWQAVTAAATGEFVKLVCADDLLHAECLGEQVAAMDAHPGVSLVSARREIVDAQGAPVLGARGGGGLRGRHDGRVAIRRTVRSGTNIFGEPAAVLLRRADLAAVGGWWADYPYVIDVATYALVLLRGDLYAVDRPLAAFRVSAGQWSVALADRQAAQVIGFHTELARREPGLLSRADRFRGAAMAHGLARARGAFYLLARRRMRTG